jgi:hypothetical protein
VATGGRRDADPAVACEEARQALAVKPDIRHEQDPDHQSRQPNAGLGQRNGDVGASG